MKQVQSKTEAESIQKESIGQEQPDCTSENHKLL